VQGKLQDRVAIVFGAGSDDAAYINGVALPVDGGLHAKAGV
jgi:NAD(P)-dependent dehydrogenase (short-subunit alcohol dehydrogenase family)